MGKVITDENKIEELLTRGIESFEGKENIFPSKEEARKVFKEGRKLKIYLGIDPTGPDLHLGHTIPLFFLKRLWKLGHTPVLVIGDFTARIGDPTGKETSRKFLTKDEVKENMKNYLKQIKKILPKFEIKYNSKWLSMKLDEFMKIAAYITPFQLQARSMFRERAEKGSFLGVNEFLYPLLQGYDSVAMNIEGEVGGSDQIFNMLIGRDLMRKMLNKEKLVVGMKLLVDPDSGKKMSKTEGNLISLSDLPDDMFGKIMALPDSIISLMFETCTEKDWKWVSGISSDLDNNPLYYKKELAFELVRMYHSEKEAQEAKKEFEEVFSRGGIPEGIEELILDNKEIELLELLEKSELVSSKSEAKRLVEEGGVQIDGVKKENWSQSLILKGGEILKVGPRRFKRINLKPR